MDRHVTDILESAPFAELSETELASVRAHAVRCAVKERAAAVFEPSPFFQTRVMAALRERQASNAPFSFARLWKSAGALVASMAATVALLAGLTFVAPQTASETTTDVASVANPYTADEVILNQAEAAGDDVTNDQVLSTIYEQDDDNAR